MKRTIWSLTLASLLTLSLVLGPVSVPVLSAMESKQQTILSADNEDVTGGTKTGTAAPTTTPAGADGVGQPQAQTPPAAAPAPNATGGGFADFIQKLGGALAQVVQLITNIFQGFFGGDIAGTGGNTAGAAEGGAAADGATAGGATGTGNTDTGTTGATGALQQKIIAEAKKLVGVRNFPYAAATNGGRLGCAQVVTTALKAAGALTSTDLSVMGTISKLKAKGWTEVKPPPYKAGDVITWKTYTRSDGRKDTHVGIIMGSGNSVQAMSNSSSQRMPRIHSATYAPVMRVLRKA